MIKYSLGFIFMMMILGIISISCNRKKTKLEETPTRGRISILVDETFFPMIEDQILVFESQYKYAKFDILVQPEQEILNSFVEDTSRVAILSRDLSNKELAYFDKRKLIPQITALAYDAIALIVNKSNPDTSITISQLKSMLKNEPCGNESILIFDNSKSGTVQYILHKVDLQHLPKKGVYSLNNNEEVIQYVAKHENTIGFVGINWLYQASKEQQSYVDKVKVLAVGSDGNFHKPSQETIASEEYPFIRKIRLINCQGKTGLGKGLASFIAGDQGQRIVLKAGLVPVTFPKREIKVREKL